jgi:5-methylcytosine-specific restriction endonuclease McrA
MAASGSPARYEPRIRLRGFESGPWPLRRARAISGSRNVAAYILCMEHTATLESVPDDELLRRLSELLRQSRRVDADLVAHVGEVDARRLFAREASPSMFAYCTQVLHLSEFEAYLRITVARAARQHPVLLEMLREGSLHLTAIAKLAPHLTRENCETVLASAAHRTKRELEELIAELAPRPDAPTVVRKLPDRGTATAPVDALRQDSNRIVALDRGLGLDRVEPPALKRSPSGAPGRPATERIGPAPPLTEAGQCLADSRDSGRAASGSVQPASIEPLSPARYRVQFTARAEFRDKLERLKALMRPSVPDGDLAAILEQAVTEKLERLEAKRFAKTNAPRKGPATSDASPSTRHIPATVRRAVYERDEGRCRYVDQQGRRCTARDGLEFHHRQPFAHGGGHSLENIALACKSHNRFLAEIDYGREAMERHRRFRSGASPRRESRAAPGERPGPSDAPTAPWPRSAPPG